MPENLLHNEKELLRLIAGSNEVTFREVYDYYRITVNSSAYTQIHTDTMAIRTPFQAIHIEVCVSKLGKRIFKNN